MKFLILLIVCSSAYSLGLKEDEEKKASDGTISENGVIDPDDLTDSKKIPNKRLVHCSLLRYFKITLWPSTVRIRTPIPTMLKPKRMSSVTSLQSGDAVTFCSVSISSLITSIRGNPFKPRCAVRNAFFNCLKVSKEKSCSGVKRKHHKKKKPKTESTDGQTENNGQLPPHHPQRFRQRLAKTLWNTRSCLLGFDYYYTNQN